MAERERFDEKWTPEPNTGCHLWTGARNSKGYGQTSLNGRLVYAHRFAYERAHGPVPKGLELDHLCRQPLCVNPRHLEAVTHSENMLRIPLGDCCRRGHPFDEANTYRHGRVRECRACKREKQNEWNAARRKERSNGKA